MNRKLTLTTKQMTPGIMISRPTGPEFYSIRLVGLLVLFWLAGLLARLFVDTTAAAHLLARLVLANIAHHLHILWVGVQVVTGGYRYGY